MQNQVVEYSVAEAEISKMASIYMDLTIDGLDDEEGFKQVKEARLIVKSKRCAVENQRKAYKKDALEYGKMVDGKAKEIFALIEPIETHLQTEENKVKDALDAIKAKKDAEERERIQARVDELKGYDFTMEFFTLATMDDEAYSALLQTVKGSFEAEQARIAEEARIEQERKDKEGADRKAENERLAKQKAEQDAERAELDRIRKEIEAGKQAIADAASRHQEKIDATNREAERQKEIEPDKDKILTWIDNVQSIVEPELSSPEAQELLESMVDGIYQVLAAFTRKVEEL